MIWKKIIIKFFALDFVFFWKKAKNVQILGHYGVVYTTFVKNLLKILDNFIFFVTFFWNSIKSSCFRTEIIQLISEWYKDGQQVIKFSEWAIIDQKCTKTWSKMKKKSWQKVVKKLTKNKKKLVYKKWTNQKTSFLFTFESEKCWQIFFRKLLTKIGVDNSVVTHILVQKFASMFFDP